MAITIVGSSGYLGKNISSFFKGSGETVVEITRDSIIDANKNYGAVIYCAGISIDFNNKPFETVDAHVVLLMQWLKTANFEKLIYISSSRLYNNIDIGDEFSKNILMPIDDIYNQTKLLAENLCLSSNRNTIVLRVSNITGYNEKSPYFIWNIFRQLKIKNLVSIHETKNSARDYLPLPDFLNVIKLLAESSFNGLFNVSSGVNLTHESLMTLLSIKNEKVRFGDKENNPPLISNKKIKEALGYTFQNPKTYIQNLCQQFLGSNRYDNKK